MTTQDEKPIDVAEQPAQTELLMRFYASPAQPLSAEYGNVKHITLIVPSGTQVWMDVEQDDKL
jgi:hypothetical protein